MVYSFPDRNHCRCFLSDFDFGCDSELELGSGSGSDTSGLGFPAMTQSHLDLGSIQGTFVMGFASISRSS